MMEFDVELDVRNLACPLPILRCKKSLSTMASGQVLYIRATDQAAPKDFEVFCRQTGNTLLASNEKEDIYHFFIRRR